MINAVGGILCQPVTQCLRFAWKVTRGILSRCFATSFRPVSEISTSFCCSLKLSMPNSRHQCPPSALLRFLLGPAASIDYQVTSISVISVHTLAVSLMRSVSPAWLPAPTDVLKSSLPFFSFFPYSSSMIVLSFPRQKGCGSENLPSSCLVTPWCCVCRKLWWIASRAPSPLDL